MAADHIDQFAVDFVFKHKCDGMMTQVVQTLLMELGEAA